MSPPHLLSLARQRASTAALGPLALAALTLCAGGCSGSTTESPGRSTDGGASGGASTGGASTGGAAGDAGASGVAGAAPSGSGGTTACTHCLEYAPPEPHVSLAGAELQNLSGAAFGWRNPGILFAHNDADEGLVFAVAEDGTIVARFLLPDSGAVDLEDMGVGPCPDGTCLYLADIGGNRSARTEYSIYRTPEPLVAPAAGSPPVPVTFERFRFTYDDGASHNAESLLVEPATGALYVITKEPAGQPSVIYRLPHPPDPGAVNRADRVRELPVPGPANRETTGASAHPCGAGFLLRTYDDLFEFSVPPGTPLEEAFGTLPSSRPAATEAQSEAVAYRPDGRSYVTSGEVTSQLHPVRCR